MVNSEVDCRNCGQKLTVPEATPDRVARALALLEEIPESQAPKDFIKECVTDFDRQYSEQKLVEIALKESTVPLSQMDFQGYPPAPIMSRLIASFVDSALSFISCLVGIMLIVWLAKSGMMENPLDAIRLHRPLNPAILVILGWTPALLVVGQWYLLATSGQTIGKKLLMIRIVSESGSLPGFLRAVVLRNWVRALLSLIPFFGLIDVLFIFSDSRKCLHDYIAGTKVVGVV